MRRKLAVGIGLVSFLAVAVLVRQALSGRDGLSSDKVDTARTKAPPLPVKQVVLFNSGVGYFQREGQVPADASVNLTFATTDINDLLKSLVLEAQGGGKVGTVSYDSHDPLDKILHSFALDLNNNPTLGQILNQARGEKIELKLRPGANAVVAPIKGTIVGMETRKKAPAAEAAGLAMPSDVDVLNLLGEEGLQSVVLDQVQSIRFQSPVLDTEFRRALQVLASSHDMQKKSVSLRFNGDGVHQVRVGYVVDQPIWKMSYRLRLEGGGKVFLQGWALVDNTTDEDWKDVRMALVSGRPISFQMNLHEPLYVPRPKVEPELFASLRPPVYGAALAPDTSPDKKGGQGLMGQFGGQLAGFAGGFGGGLGGFGGHFQGIPGGQIQGGFNIQGGQMNPYQAGPFLNPYGPERKLTYDELQKRRQELREARKKAGELGRAVTGLNFKEGIEAATAGAVVGDYFQYRIKDKVNLSRQRSAMIPVLAQTVAGSKVSIYNEAVEAQHPLLGLRLKNTSDQPLTQGPITVYDENTYAGDTRILHVQPGEQRLLSYALDLATEVVPTVRQRPGPEMTLRVSGDNLTARYTLRQTKTYRVSNRNREACTVVVEHPVRSDWKLVEPAQPTERTRQAYRFDVKAPAGKTTTLHVVEEQPRVDPIARVRPNDAEPYYAIAQGIAIKTLVKASRPELLELKIVKGALHARRRNQESKTYVIQNLSDIDRTFVVQHVVPKGWSVASADGKRKEGPHVHSFKVEVRAKETLAREVVQEQETVDRSASVEHASFDAVRDYLASPAVGKEVKAALERSNSLYGKLKESERELGDAQGQLKAAGTDQARMRDNLKIIPQNNPAYKRFLDKFLVQETEIETLQRRVRQLEAALQKQRSEYEDYVRTLNAG